MAFHEVLRRCGYNLTRQNLMRQATSLRNVAQPMLLDGGTLNTSPTNHHPVAKMHPVRFDGKHWQLLNDAAGADNVKVLTCRRTIGICPTNSRAGKLRLLNWIAGPTHPDTRPE